MAGFLAMVCERERFPRFHVGESLLPLSAPLLRRLGVWERLHAGGFQRKWGAHLLFEPEGVGSRVVFAHGLDPGNPMGLGRDGGDILVVGGPAGWYWLIPLDADRGARHARPAGYHLRSPRRPNMTRMRPRALAAALLLASLGLPLAAAAAPAAVGAEITVAETTPIAEILAAPDRHAGKTVRVEGEVHGVCTRMGCWMDIADESGRSLRIQVEDGVLVFPSDAVGRPAVAQGTVTMKEMTRADYVAWQRHLAEEGGKPFDEAAVGEGPFRVVHIAGTGARIGE